MNKLKESAIWLGVLLPLVCFTACIKDAFSKNSGTTAQPAANHSLVYYTNSKSAMYVVELVGVDSKLAFTSVISPGSKPGRLTLPANLTSGYYDIVITPEGAYSGTVTHYAIGGVSGSAGKYPATIKGAYLTMNNADSVSISLN